MLSRRTSCVLLALAAIVSVLGLPPSVQAQDDSCIDVCGATCVKPWAIPDRWDDATGVPGYRGDGGGRRPIDWRNNQHWDGEAFVDANDSRIWDAGETFIDGNGNGSYDAEPYHPSLTGYVAYSVPGNFLSPNGDIGLELILHPAGAGDAPEPGQYYSIALPPLNKGTPVAEAGAYRENIAGCNPALVEPADWLQLFSGGMVGPTNQGMSDLIAQDPNAYWDDATQSVQNSSFALSPRIVFLPFHDPRFPGGTFNTFQVTKIVAFFMEQMTGQAEVRGRFLRTQAPGSTFGPACPAGQGGGFIVECPVPATTASWGRLKATYR